MGLTHANACKTIIENLNATATVTTYIGSFQAGVQYALDNGYAIVSRSTTGLDDNDVTAGDDMVTALGMAIHAHHSNTPATEESDVYSSVQSIISVRDLDGSYGTGIEFTLTEYTNESYTTAYMAGKMAEYGIGYPALSYTVIRGAIRDNASNGGTWEAITGYGTPDWDATETALALL